MTPYPFTKLRAMCRTLEHFTFVNALEALALPDEQRLELERVVIQTFAIVRDDRYGL